MAEYKMELDKMKHEKYQGIVPAFYACYGEDGEIDVARTKTFARHLVDRGVQGLYVGGSSGECIYQSVEDRKTSLEAVMAEVGDEVVVIAHVAANNTKDSQELARHAESLGVDAIAAIPPIYFRLPEASIAAYWNDISAAAPKTDFFIYNIPQLAGVALTPSLFKVMLENPRVVGVKNSSMPVQDIELFKSTGGEDVIIYNGPDEQFVAGRLMGAAGGIGGTYAAMPELFLSADRAIKEGDFDRAQKIQFDINQNIYAFVGFEGNMYAVIKAVLHELHGLEFGGVRAPLSNLTEADKEKIPAVAEQVKASIERWA